ncbi:TonB-dependent receptor plug domain-containing protein [Rhizorhabdus argentea]|uniref:TonB-dependent receptor plug domain-containing protein n=1 Tax=Rhizorhabdus argentea TaxID=1387174 RepID=UPI0030EF5B22
MKKIRTVSWTVIALAGMAASAATAQSSPPEDPDAEGATIIVTGTRSGGITAAESATPIKLVSQEAIEHVGQPNLNQVLTQLVPSFTAQAYGGDTANLTLSARLRGLSPNHTLVLINGKRRHGTANLAVLGGPYQGAAAPDLDLISPSSIARIEVLEDGAAAQYGSDAIAGVINIILKDDDEGVSGYGTYGKTYDVGGETYAGTLHFGTKLGEDGYFNATLFHRFHDFSQLGGLDARVVDQSGNLLTSYSSDPALSAAIRAADATIPGLPYVNRINGDARSHLTNLQYNSGYDFGDFEVYGFGSYSKRIASAYENLRPPTRVVAGPVLGTSATLTTPGALIFAPSGFNPREKIREDDYAITGGIRGDLGSFHYDLSSTYGQDKNQIYTVDSVNPDLFIDTHASPIGFYDGSFTSEEWTTTADFTKEMEVGMAAPMNIAFGAEYRWNRYTIGAGDPSSYYKAGASSYPGFRPSDAGSNTRKAESAYLDIAITPIDGWKADGAVRYEHYSDFGTKVIFKGTSRYDFSDALALRGTVSTGFRAPTLAESFYSATNVGPTTAFVQLPANSAAAKLVGFQNLEPEKSTNFSVGTVIRPAPAVTITLDAYQVKIKNRILGTGAIFSSGGARNFTAVRDAVVANGNILDNTVTQTGISLFTNGADTRTRGVDLTASYTSNFDDYGKVNWTLSANYNKTKITKVGLGPVLTDTAGVTSPIALFDQTTISNIENASPSVKVVASAFWTLGDFSATVRETLFGKSSQDVSPDGGTFYRQRIKTAAITDVELNYKLTQAFELSVGANNLFNKKAPKIQVLSDGTIVDGGAVYDAPLSFSPYGINGGYYYVRVNFDF